MRRILLPIFSAILLLCACNRVPSHVIPPDDMAEILADVRMADAVVTVNIRDYSSVAKKMAVKEAVFKKHGITDEQFDTSMVWYGHNVDKFQDVNDLAIEILEKRLKDANALAAGEAAMTVAGDSVDLWNGYPSYVFSKKLPSSYLTFSYDSDQNWERGDIYTLRSHVVLPGSSGQWNLTTEYEDGTVDIITSAISQNELSRQELSLYTDSTRTATRISGWIKIDPFGYKVAILDSISLTRRHLEPGTTVTRPYQQRHYEPKQKNNDEYNTTDTIPKEDIQTLSVQESSVQRQ